MPPRASGASISSLLQPAPNSSHCDISRYFNKESSAVLICQSACSTLHGKLPAVHSWQVAHSLLLNSCPKSHDAKSSEKVLQYGPIKSCHGSCMWQMQLKNAEPADGIALCCCKNKSLPH